MVGPCPNGWLDRCAGHCGGAPGSPRRDDHHLPDARGERADDRADCARGRQVLPAAGVLQWRASAARGLSRQGDLHRRVERQPDRRVRGARISPRPDDQLPWHGAHPQACQRLGEPWRQDLPCPARYRGHPGPCPCAPGAQGIRRERRLCDAAGSVQAHDLCRAGAQRPAPAFLRELERSARFGGCPARGRPPPAPLACGHRGERQRQCRI